MGAWFAAYPEALASVGSRTPSRTPKRHQVWVRASRSRSNWPPRSSSNGHLNFLASEGLPHPAGEGPLLYSSGFLLRLRLLAEAPRRFRPGAFQPGRPVFLFLSFPVTEPSWCLHSASTAIHPCPLYPRVF